MTEQVLGVADHRLMLVHAHPDDETINNGATMARYAAAGAEVCLVTCTMGEEGEVLIPDLAHLGAEHEDSLGPTRMRELDAAMAILGVTDYVRLGGDYRFRDSGMAWSEERLAIPRDVLRPGIFWTADLQEAADELVPLIRARRPQVLVTYNEVGGYGHPDHVQAHRVAMYGYLLAGVPSYRPELGEAWTVDRVLWSTMSVSRMRAMIAELRAAGDMKALADFEPLLADDAGSIPMASADDGIAAAIDGTPWSRQKIDAMLAHSTQITADGAFFQGAEILGDRAWAWEYYRLAAGRPFPGDGWADDLFAGLD